MNNDKLAKTITVIAIILFLIFIFAITPSGDELQSGDIQHAIETNQYK